MHKTSDYTVIDNGIFRDTELTYAEVGFLCKILSLPEGWHFAVEGIVGTSCEGRDRAYAIIRQLIKHGYCKRTQNKDGKSGRYQNYDYTFYEVKYGLGCDSEPHTALPDTDTPYTDSPYPETPTHIKYLKNKVLIKSSTDKKKESKDSKERFDFVSSLLSIGVSKDAAEQWLLVRKTKRATNTEIAFNRLKAEIDKSGHSADECIRFAVENSYSGFKAEWMPKKQEEQMVAFDLEKYIRENKHKYE